MIDCSVLLLAVATVASVIDHGLPISCLDEQNQPVDWLVAYKLPKLTGNANKLIRSGAAYAYMSNRSSDKWILSSNKVSQLSGTPFSNTMAPVYANTSGRIGALYYNDQPPNKTECSSSKGHSKGLVVIDDTDSSAIWIVHRVPHFPPASGPFVYPGTGFLYGQHFFCVSLTGGDVETIGTQFLYTRPCYYGVNLTTAQPHTYPILASTAINGTYVNQAPWNRSVPLKTRSGVPLVHFAKYTNFGADLYHDFVAGGLGSALRTETWQNDGAADRLASNCSGAYSVQNVVFTNLTIDGANASFPEQNDHAKWAVAFNWSQVAVGTTHRDRDAQAQKGTQPENLGLQLQHGERYDGQVVKMEMPREEASPLWWVCLGDINREKTQFKRPGGTLCIYNQAIWTQFNSSVLQVEPCAH